MKGGRLKIVNESSYPTDEVEALVRYGLSEIDLTGHRIVAVVKHTKGRGRYSGTAWSLTSGIPSRLYDRYCGQRTHTHHLIVMRIGAPSCFPTNASITERPEETFASWQEALIAITAHEGKHAEHDHDGAYVEKSGRRKVKSSHRLSTGKVVKLPRIVKVRVGGERIEPKCEAFEAYMLRRYRDTLAGVGVAGGALHNSPGPFSR